MQLHCIDLCVLLLPTVTWANYNESSAGTGAVYNEALAKYYAQFVQVAMCSAAKVKNWSCGHPCRSTGAVPDALHLLGPSSVYKVGGYVALLHGFSAKGGPHCIVAFAGTSFHSTNNIMADALFWLSDWQPERRFCTIEAVDCSECQVMYGMAKAYEELRDQMFMSIQQLGCGGGVTFAGHSLGGGLATLASMDFRNCVDHPRVNNVYTYAMPRIGNTNFVEAYLSSARQRKADTPMWRVVHYHDLIPRLPFFRLGYRHVPQEVLYTSENSSTFKICHTMPPPQWEDPDCILAATDHGTMADHNNYFSDSFTFDEDRLPETCIPTSEMSRKKVWFNIEFGLASFFVLCICGFCCFYLYLCGCCCSCCKKNRTERLNAAQTLE